MDKKVEDKTLQQLFEDRDVTYHQLTAQIVERLDFVFEAIVEVLDLDPTVVSWEGIDIHGIMLVLVGKIGPSIQTPEQLRVVTIGIPLPIVFSNSKDYVVKFLKKHAVDQSNTEETEQSIENSLQSNTDEKPLVSVEDTSFTRPVTKSGETKFEYEKRNRTRKRTLH